MAEETYEQTSKRIRRESETETRIRSMDVGDIVGEIHRLEDIRDALYEALEECAAYVDAIAKQLNQTNETIPGAAAKRARTALARARGETEGD